MRAPRTGAAMPAACALAAAALLATLALARDSDDYKPYVSIASLVGEAPTRPTRLPHYQVRHTCPFAVDWGVRRVRRAGAMWRMRRLCAPHRAMGVCVATESALPLPRASPLPGAAQPPVAALRPSQRPPATTP